MVARGGNAPPSTGCKPAALLLSYRANEKEWHPHSVMLRGFLVENQACCYCTMRAINRSFVFRRLDAVTFTGSPRTAARMGVFCASRLKAKLRTDKKMAERQGLAPRTPVKV
jgi:hypothetical protein